MHTPGPWGYEADNDFYNEPNGACYVDLAASASLGDDSRFARVDKGPTAKADARLIAAAPDLLEACYEAIRMLNSHSTTPIPDGEFNRITRILSDAISKATI